MKGLNPSHAAGIDNLSCKLLKDVGDILARLISLLCDLSMELNSFPRSCKFPIFKLFFKKGFKLILKTTALFHYCLSYKKYWNHCSVKAHKFLRKDKIIHRFQSGFWKHYTTNICLRNLTDKITTGFERNLFTEMILVELEKGLETIDHQILLQKMKYLDFLKNVIVWLKFYFSKRKYKTDINTSYSSQTNLICGVLEGSILGLFLFLLYLIDLLQAIVSD